MRKRFLWLSMATFLLGLAVLVYRGPWRALVRGSFGDALAAAFVVFALGVMFPRVRACWRYAAGFAIACAFELVQVLKLPIADSTAGRLILGQHFDALDILWYGIGVALASAAEFAMMKNIRATLTAVLCTLFAISCGGANGSQPSSSAATAPPVVAPAPAIDAAAPSPMPAIGEYRQEHTIWAVCEDPDGCNEPVENRIRILRHDGTSMFVKINIVGANFHVCGYEGLLHQTAEQSWQGAAPDGDSECTLKLVANAQSIKVSADGCRDYCGARAYFDSEYEISTRSEIKADDEDDQD